MEVFEVHITGDENIIEVCKNNGYKSISVDLLKPNQSILRTEYMTSMILKHNNYKECKIAVDNCVNIIKNNKVNVIRVKIESPFYEHYIDQSLYMESHFEATNDKYPMSRNKRKTTILATEREYDKKLYNQFINRWKDSKELELCLYDTWIDEDKDWFELYENNRS